MKVYGKPTNTFYKVEVREKDLTIANLNSEWMKEGFEEGLPEPRGQAYEETAEEIEIYTPEE
ncbi:hypothetical protein A2U01_0092510, partial [Trifolium medium]|nr:hypothetical protein [Trifolium medium]